MLIRTAGRGDAAAINQIYNHYVRCSVATFDLQPWTDARRARWIDELQANELHHIVIAESRGQIIGFAYNGEFRARAAYRFSTETSVYAAPPIASEFASGVAHNAAANSAQGKSRGVGRALYRELFARIAKTELHRAYAVIALPNPASIALHKRFGFYEVGVLKQVGFKFGGYVDVGWYEKIIK